MKKRKPVDQALIPILQLKPTVLIVIKATSVLIKL